MGSIANDMKSAQPMPALLSWFDVQGHRAVVLLREDKAAAVAMHIAPLILQAALLLHSWLQ